MKNILSFIAISAIIVLFVIPPHSFSSGSTGFQQQNYGLYYVPVSSEWSFNSSESSGEFYVFENSSKGLKVSIKKEPWFCETKQDFNRIILEIIQGYYKRQEFMELRKSAVPYSCLGVSNMHMLKIKSRTSSQPKFVLNPLIETQMYSIEILEPANRNEPSPEALSFIAGITLSPGSEVVSNTRSTSVQQNERIRQTSVQTPAQSQTAADDGLSAFKKIKTTAPVQTTATAQSSTAVEERKNETVSNPVAKETPKIAATNDVKQAFVPTTSISMPDVKIEKGIIPQVKFSATDPCSPGNPGSKGLPWEDAAKTEVKLPSGADAAIPAALPDIKELSDVSYNSAVSAAFEGMRLVYGPLPDDEAKKFEAAWTPLFDYQTQEIIDYLNKLNPMVCQFLASREAYTRTLNDIQMVLLDAAMAIEMDEQQAWEAAMAEAGLYSSALPPLEAGMKSLAKQIEALGNPPNPSDAKCEARRRYNRTFQSTAVPEGCWAGFHDNLFISSPELGLVYDPFFEYIFKVNVGGAEKYYGLRVCMDCNIGFTSTRGNVSYGNYSDKFIRENMMGVETYTGTWIDGPREGQFSQFVQKFEYPNIPEFSETSNGTLLNVLEKDRAENNGSSIWENTIQKWIQSKTFAHAFYEKALEWEAENRWQDYEFSDESWMTPDELLLDFNNEVGGSPAVSTNTKKQESAKQPATQLAVSATTDEAKQAELDRKEAIDFHTEMVDVLKHNLDREMAERNEVMKSLSQSKNKAEAEEHARRLEELNMRIIGIQSNMQSEQDLVSSFKTGQLVHTRTVFVEYARVKFIDDIRENAARMDATRRIAERIDRQIELLPPEMRAEARERASKILDGKTVGSGDIEKAKELVNAFNNQIQGYAEYDRAKAEEAEVDASENEFYAKTTVMAAGACFVGFGSAALAEAFGAEAAIAVYGPNALGAIYGGATGTIAGGPKEGVIQAISWMSPKGFAAMQFLEGYENAGYQKDATTSTKVWEGVKQAGTALFLGKVIEYGAGLVTKGSLIVFGKESRLFKPVVSTPGQRSTQLLDAMRTTQKITNAQDDVKAFQNLEVELAVLKRNPAANSQKIAQMEAELQQLSASLNADYYAKWLFKYKASPGLRRQFDLRVQKNYSEMTPGMITRLEQQGYNMENIEFRQFRNATSSGSSSMDLDLGPVMKGTTNEPGIQMFKSKMVMKKDGSMVTLEQFMKDSQAAMNAEYRQLHGISAPSSDMNMVTSAHAEAFSTPKLLDHNIDFSSFSVEEVASIGKVLNVKMDGINKNVMMTNTTKMQAKCRESAKEIENMLLRKLRSDLQKAPSGSPQQKQIQADINYWEDMLARFKNIGMEETNPMKIIEMNRQIMKDTGGKDVTGVINDLTAAFGK